MLEGRPSLDIRCGLGIMNKKKKAARDQMSRDGKMK